MMATYPQFGGSNGVAELDIGQKGSARRAANQATHPAKVREGAIKAPEVVNALMQQGLSYVEIMSYQEQEVIWTGTLRVASAAIRAAIRSDLAMYRYGQTITDGVPSTYNRLWVQPTLLADAYGTILSVRAKLIDWAWGDFSSVTGGPYYTIAVPLTLRFTLLG